MIDILYAKNVFSGMRMTYGVSSYAGNHRSTVDPNYVKTVAPKTYEWLKQLVEDEPDVNRWIHFNSFGAAPVAAALWAGQSDESNAADAPLQPSSPSNSFAGMASAPRQATPFRPTSEVTKGSAHGLAELAKVLSQYGLYPQEPKNEKYQKLVQALVDLKTKWKPQFYGGPR